MSKKKGTLSMEAWSKLNDKLVAMGDLLHKNQSNLQQLEKEYEASQDERERKYKTAKLNLIDEIKFFEGLREDTVATKAAVRAKLESVASEEEEEEDKEEEDEDEGPRGPEIRKPGEENPTRKRMTRGPETRIWRGFGEENPIREKVPRRLETRKSGEENPTRKELDKGLKAEAEKRLKEKRADPALIAFNSKMDRMQSLTDRLITAISEGKVVLDVHEMLEMFEVLEELEALEEVRLEMRLELEALERMSCSRVREGLERTTGPRKEPCKGSTSTPGQNRGPAPLARIEEDERSKV